MMQLRRYLAVAALAAPLALTACGGSSSTTPSGNADLNVLAFDTRFDKSQYTVAAKEAGLVFELVNKGNLVHDLVIEDHKEVYLSAAPGSNRTSKPINLPAGTYTIFCDIAGHRDSGMQATLTIT